MYYYKLNCFTFVVGSIAVVPLETDMYGVNVSTNPRIKSLVNRNRLINSASLVSWITLLTGLSGLTTSLLPSSISFKSDTNCNSCMSIPYISMVHTRIKLQKKHTQNTIKYKSFYTDYTPRLLFVDASTRMNDHR